MNLAEMRASVDLRSGVGLTDAATNDAINEALARLSTVDDWPWLVAEPLELEAVADEGQYDLEPDTRKVLSVTVEEMPCTWVAPDVIDSWDGASGAPARAYTVRGLLLDLRPLPAEADEIIVRYLVHEPRLTADDDEPLLPSAYHDVLVDFAAGIALERVGELARADRSMDRFDKWVKSMRATARRQGPDVGRIRVRPGLGF